MTAGDPELSSLLADRAPRPGCKNCRVIGELCGLCENQLLAMPRRRPRDAMKSDALSSILRVLEPLTPDEREHCLASARCVYNELAAHQALEGLG